MRGFDEVTARVKSRFGRSWIRRSCPLHDFWIFNARDKGSGKPAFDVIIFYRSDADIEASAENGVSSEIEDFVYAELDRLGRGCRDQIDVEFEYDSDENVKKNFGGSYFARLH